MTREEAIEVVKRTKGAMVYTEKEKEALETLIPELTESEDERIIKTLQEYVKNRNWPLNGPSQGEVLAWLERQKEPLGDISTILLIKKWIDERKEIWNKSRKEAIALDCSALADDAVVRIEELNSVISFLGTIQCNSTEKQKESLHIPETCKENADSFTDDEKIRKELIEYHKRQFENNRDQEVGLFHKDAIAYLEKQKEQKPGEDEKIRKELIEFIQWSEDRGMTRHDFYQAKRPAEWIAYLEKRKEENWNKKPCLTCQEYEKGHKQGYTEGCTAGYNKAMKEVEQVEEGYEEIPVESTLEYKLGFKAGKESEKEKDRLAPIYEDIDSFESALKKAWKDYDEGYRKVDSLEDDYVECAHAKGFREGYLFGLEKQKEASKAIEAIERIDKYIDEHLANAHDMKDSNPDKKYYRGWDDALGEMAKILQDVYSGEKQKEQKDYNKLYEDIGKSEWFKKAYEGKSLGCDYEQKEQKPIEPSDEELQRYQNELYDFKVFATKQAKEHHISHVHDFEWNNFCAGLLSYFNEQKPVEWSDEDSDNLERVDNYLWMLDNYVGDDCATPQGKSDKIRGNIQEVLSPWLKNLPKRFRPQPKQEWSEEDKAHIESLLKRLDGMCKKGATFTQTRFAVSEDMDWLKDLRPWKPNVEKLYYDRVNKEFYVKETINDPKSAIQELYKRLNKR